MTAENGHSVTTQIMNKHREEKGNSRLMFFGRADTLVAAVETLRVLELLYRVKADVEVPALEVVLTELRQFLETIELALDATGRVLRMLLGEIPRLYRLSANAPRSRDSGLGDDLSSKDLLLTLDIL
jgi:hypothetical protein